RIVQIGMITMPAARLIALGVAVTAIVVFLLLFRFTNWGLAMRVSNQDAEVAKLMGVRLSRVSWTSWAIGGALAVLSGLFLASFPAAGVAPSLADTAFRAFPAAVIGGLGSVGGALVGGMMLGLAEAFAATYESALGGWAHNLSGISAWILLLVVLL
ncbi:ABC transporter permease subunit, partial [Prescottella defluvii]